MATTAAIKPSKKPAHEQDKVAVVQAAKATDYYLPSTTVSFDQFSQLEQQKILNAYNDAMQENEARLPRIQFSVRSRRNKKSLKNSKMKKIKNVFTEGLSSKSTKDDPVFYLRNQFILTSNQPGSLHYVRDNSKLIIQPSDSQNKQAVRSKISFKQPLQNTILEAPELGELSECVKITRNNTMLLPKIFMERELPLSDTLVKTPRPYSPRQKLTMQYLQYADSVKDNIPLSVIAESQLLNRDSIVPNNSPMKSTTELYDEDIRQLEKQQSFLEGDVREEYGNLTERSQVTISSRMSEVPVVSVGAEDNLEYYRRFNPKTSRSVMEFGDDYSLTRPSTMESRYALSTPGRKIKPHTNKPLFFQKEKQTQKGVVIAEEENQVHGDAGKGDNMVANSVKRITIGDPHKDTNKLDTKLNNSKLDDLYKRGVVQKQTGNHRGYIPRSPVKRVYDRLYSRASGVSTVLGNPPPSIATMAPSPPIDMPLVFPTVIPVPKMTGENSRSVSTRVNFLVDKEPPRC